MDEKCKTRQEKKGFGKFYGKKGKEIYQEIDLLEKEKYKSMAENWTRKTKREYKIEAEVAKIKHSGTKKYKHKIKIPQGFWYTNNDATAKEIKLLYCDNKN